MVKGRLVFISLMLMVILLVGCGGEMEDKTHREPMRYLGQVMDRLLDVAEEVHESIGLVPTDLWGRIQPSAYSYGFSTGKLSQWVTLEAGRDYVFIAAGDEDVHELFITLVGSDRSVLAGNSGSEGIVALFYRPEMPKRLLVEAVNVSRSSTTLLGTSTDRPGFFAVMMLAADTGWQSDPIGHVREGWEATKRAYLEEGQAHGELWFDNLNISVVGSLLRPGSRTLRLHETLVGEPLGGQLIGSREYVILANGSGRVNSMRLRVHERNERSTTFESLAGDQIIAESSGASPVVSFVTKPRQHYAVEYRNDRSSGHGFIMYLLVRR